MASARPASKSRLVSVRMRFRSPTHRSWCSVPARLTPPTTRWPSGCRSARPSTMAADPEPSVSVANCYRRSSAVASAAASRSSVRSWV